MALVADDLRQEEIVRLLRRQRRAFEEGDGFVEHARVVGRLHVLRDRIGEPGPIVRNPRAHALSGMRQPPMLHVALGRTAAGRAQQMLARQVGPRGDERHAVLQLIAEAIGAAGLIEGRTRPDATGERLVEQPTVEHEIHRAVRRLDLDRAQRLAPEGRDISFDGVEVGGPPGSDRRAGLLARGRVAEEKHDFGDAADGQFDLGAHRGAGVEARAERLRQRRPAQQAPPGSPNSRCGR